MTKSAICPACGCEQDRHADPCGDCGAPMRLNDRYRLHALLARRAGSSTYEGFDEDSDQAVVIKELALRTTESVKEVELFEREAAILERLEHPAIPAFRAHFEVQRQRTLSLYVVQDAVEGAPLSSRPRYTPQEIARIVAELLVVLEYLRTIAPPVVHRDIKPANILQRADGSLALVDFGAASVVETLYRAGSTVTGTFGYMAPEQMVGSAVPATDVFGLGATALRLMTGREPQDLWSDGARFDYARETFDSGLVGLIDAMTASDPADRPSDLAGLRDDLERFSSGDQGVLKKYEGALAIAASGDQLPRQSPRSAQIAAAWSIGRVVLAMLVAVAAIWATGFNMQYLTLYIFVIGLPLPLFTFAARRTAFHWRTARALAKHVGVRGVVTSRRIARHQSTTFGIIRREYIVGTLFHVDGRPVEAESAVSESLFSAVETGVEVAVWYDPREPSNAVVTALPDPRGGRLLT